MLILIYISGFLKKFKFASVDKYHNMLIINEKKNFIHRRGHYPICGYFMQVLGYLELLVIGIILDTKMGF